MLFFSWYSARPGRAGRGSIDCRKHAVQTTPFPIAFIHIHILHEVVDAVEIGHQQFFPDYVFTVLSRTGFISSFTSVLVNIIVMQRMTYGKS